MGIRIEDCVVVGAQKGLETILTVDAVKEIVDIEALKKQWKYFGHLDRKDCANRIRLIRKLIAWKHHVVLTGRNNRYNDT